ncbi:MAG: His/Gly/Thr/Pro-type tRNA ligase C-terminal domain-containing protein [Patescibacteria group bacterium]|nr:His/Gly/Thr/Pro-type tRNA ligase C-terminal domain-containing protein [Patescibacteria group bacterium]MCL5224022.1 His/Gly/Thr/Pro-type tRNA ligase C-terminal domain-containing protein [Patescibacteria group bacterium]
MKQSELFTKTLREAPKDEDAVNAQLLIRAGFIDKLMAGVYTMLPLGLMVRNKIEQIVREEMAKIGGNEIVMPVLQPMANWEKTGRWNSLDVLFKFTSYYTKNDYALGPTHEEVISPLLKKFILSYKDLPRYVFQIQNKFRDEPRSKSGLLRGREFLMKDLYSFHANQKDLDKYYELVIKTYMKMYKRLGLGGNTYVTFASGGTFSKYSHEFQTVADAGEDTIYICDKCKIAVNKEIIKEQKVCPKCGGSKLREARSIEVGNIFKLSNKFSAPFGLSYRDERGNMNDVVMGCYGMGISRLVGTIVEVSHDDRGIIWPESIAPFRFHLVELRKGIGRDLYRRLQAKGDNVLYDDRELSAGEKFADADLIGIPYRLVVSEKTGKKIEVKKRDSKNTKLVGYGTISKLS